MSQSSNSGGAGFLSLLLVAFIVLKLTGVIAWSWWWVTCPFWCGLALVILVEVGVAGIGIVALVFGLLINWLRNGRKRKKVENSEVR